MGSTLPSCRKEWGSQGKGQGCGEGTERAKAVIPHNSCPGIVAHRFSMQTAHGSMLRLQTVFPTPRHASAFTHAVAHRSASPFPEAVPFPAVPVSLPDRPLGSWALRPCCRSCSHERRLADAHVSQSEVAGPDAARDRPWPVFSGKLCSQEP